MLRVLKIYFWLYVVFALASIFPIIILAMEDSVPILPWIYILAGHTLLIPAHGFLYEHTLPIRWLWWLHVPVTTTFAVAGTIGIIEVWESFSLSWPEFHWAIVLNLMFHLPLFVMAILYLGKNAGDQTHQPDKAINRAGQGSKPANPPKRGD